MLIIIVGSYLGRTHELMFHRDKNALQRSYLIRQQGLNLMWSQCSLVISTAGVDRIL